ncbi:MAG: hypothetical protein ACXWQO_14405 [Bdellovibrionota bacterium]
MKNIFAYSLLALALGANAKADFQLANNDKAVECFGEDNQSWNLNAKRTTLKFTVEGESKGAKKITKRNSDDDTFVSYSTSEGTLTLSDKGDTFKGKGEEAQAVRCK